MLLILNVVILLTCITLSSALNITECGSTKTCIFSSDGCSPDNAACLIFTFSWNATQDAFHMEISGSTGAGNQYVAVAFSPNGKMEMSDLYYCTGNELKSGALQVRQASPATDPTLPSEITNPVASTNSGVAMCSFTRAASVTKLVSSTNRQSFDLSTTPFYILQAVGEYSNGLERHATTGRFGSGPYNFITSEQVVTIPSPSIVAMATSNTRNTAADDCDVTKGCFLNPASCVPGTANCMFASWVYVNDIDAFDFEIIGGSGAQYAAIAFASSTRMLNADLYYCTASGLTSGAIKLEQKAPDVSATLPSFILVVTQQSTSKIALALIQLCSLNVTELTSGHRKCVTTARRLDISPQNNHGFSSRKTGISNVANSVNGGSVTCTFRRVSSLAKTVSGGVSVDFDLKANNYFMLYAFGGISAGDQTLIQHSASSRSASTTPLNFTQVSASSGSSSGNKVNLIKAHACFMLIAWLTCVSIGAIIARHFRPLWHDSTCFGEKVWFQLHRGLMIAVLLCTVLAFIFIFVANDGEYSSRAGAHPVLGIMVTCLVIINPVMALFRPHPGESSRKIFNWAHWLVGSVARILGLVAIFLGVDLPTLNIPEWDTWALVAFVVIHIVTEIVLELLSAYYGHIAAYKKSGPQEIPLDGQAPRDLPPKGATIKFTILLLYSVVNVAFLLAFIISIGGHE